MPMDAAARFRCVLAGVLPLVVALVVISPPAPVMAQDDIRVDGTVMWLSGQTLTLALDGQVVPGYYQIVGQYLVVVPGPRPTVNVDLRDAPQSEYAFMRSGRRIRSCGGARPTRPRRRGGDSRRTRSRRPGTRPTGGRPSSRPIRSR